MTGSTAGHSLRTLSSRASFTSLRSIATYFSELWPKHSEHQPTNLGLTSLLLRRHIGYQISSVTAVANRELAEDDVIIILLGPTGAGKSTFVQTATGQKCSVSHGLESGTRNVTALRISFSDGVDVVLVDTPGFDDTYLSDEEILKPIADWLWGRGASPHQFSAIIYLHDISENRMANKHRKGLVMLKKLFKELYDKVVLVTTMWPETEDGVEENYASREEELKSDDWAAMITGGSTTRRFRNTQESAWSIIDHIIAVESDRHWIHIQGRLMKKGDKLPNNKLGRQRRERIQNLVEKQKELLRRMKAASAQGVVDSIFVSSLQAEVRKLQKEQAEVEEWEGGRKPSGPVVSAPGEPRRRKGADPVPTPAPQPAPAFQPVSALQPAPVPQPVPSHSRKERTEAGPKKTSPDRDYSLFGRLRLLLGFRRVSRNRSPP